MRFQQRTHRYLWGGAAIATSPWCTAASSTRHADLVAAEVGQAGSRRPLNSLAAEWPTTQLGRSPRRPCPVAAPEGVGWESNFGVVLPGKTGGSVKSPVGQEKPTVSWLFSPIVSLACGGGGDRRRQGGRPTFRELGDLMGSVEKGTASWENRQPNPLRSRFEC